MTTQTLYEVAEEFRLSPGTVAKVARTQGIGANLGGRAGWRFSEADKAALWDAMRVKPIVAVRRRRRAS